MNLEPNEKCTGHGEPVERVILTPSSRKPGKTYFRCSRPLNERCQYFRMGPANNASTGGNQNNRSHEGARQRDGGAVSNNLQRQLNFENSSLFGNGPSPENNPNCKCGSAAAHRTVRKQGRNKGRKFYTCPKPVGEQCGFFEWDNTPVNANQEQQSQGAFQRTETAPVEPPKCQCDLPASDFIVRKPGRNQGRKFYTCSKPREKRCGYFEWAEDVSKKRTATAAHHSSSNAITAQPAKKQKHNPSDVIDMKMEEIDSFKFILYARFSQELKDAVKQYEGLRIEKCEMLGAEQVIIPLEKVYRFESFVKNCVGAAVERDISDDLLRRLMKYFQKENERQRREVIKAPLDEILPPLVCEKLMQFQWEGIHFALKRGGRCLIGDDMGLGKTLQAIAVARIYMKNWPLLIICPSSLRHNWKDELLNWLSNDLDEDEILVMMTGKDTAKAIRRVNIVSYDLVRKIPRTSLSKCQFVVADESHYLKSGTAKRTQAVVPLLKNAKRAVLLSGTPALSRPVELFSQVNAIAPDLFPDYQEYVQRYCNAHYGFFGYDVSGASNLQELNTLLRGSILVRRTKEAVLTQLPDKQRQVMWVQTKSKIMKEVAVVSDKLLKAREAANAAVNEDQAMRLRMAVRAAQNELYSLTGQAKIESVLEFCRDTSEAGCKFIVFAHHALVMDPIYDYVTMKLKLDAIRIDGNTKQDSRQSLCSKFQTDPNCKVAVLSITAAGVGITLTEAKVVLFAELYWNPGTLLQAEDRAHRIGQKDCVLVKYLLAKNTIDESMWGTVRKKLHVVGHSLTGAAARMEVGKEQNESSNKSVGIESYFKKVSKNPHRREVEDTPEDIDVFHEDPDEDPEASYPESRTPTQIRENNVRSEGKQGSPIMFPTRMDQLGSNELINLVGSNEEYKPVVQRRIDADRALAEKLQAEFNKEIL
ncbi:Helicase [Gracilaria domingensis]|nr:Helicase [Gracilaria domingensis]